MNLSDTLNKFALWAHSKGLINDSGTGTLFSTTNHSYTKPKNTSELLSMYETSPSLRSVAGKVAYSVASTPWVLYKTKGQDGKTYKNTTLQNAGYNARYSIKSKLNECNELKEINNHRILDLLANPNPYLTGLNVHKLTQLYLDIVGECFWILGIDGYNRPTEIWPVPPNWVNRVPNDDYEYYDIIMNGQIKTFSPNEVIWMKDLNLVDPYSRGTGIGRTLADELETDEYASKFLKTWFVNRAKPEMMIGIEGAKEDVLARAKESFERQHRGFWHGHKTFWHAGKMVVKELQQKFTDMQLSDLRKDQRDIIIHTYGVPPEIMGIIDNSNRATITGAETIYAKYTLVPRLDFLRAEIQSKLVPMFDDKLVFDYVSPVADDDDFYLEVMKVQPQIATRGEWRKRAGLLDRGDADNIHEVPMGLTAEDAPKK